MELDFSALDAIAEGGRDAGKNAPTHPQKAEGGAVPAPFAELQEGIRQSAVLRAEILREAKAGARPDALLLKALRCVALATGDGVFEAQCRKALGL